MEWNRGPSPTQPANQPAHRVGPINTAAPVKAKRSKFSWLSLRTANVGLIFCTGVLLLALVGLSIFGNPGSNEGKYVASDKMQAIFLNGGQVYFGKIRNLNDKYIRVSDIYYLRVNQTVQPNSDAAANNQDIALVKLGCELHGPSDEMVINQSQVIFWENLKNDGQVAKAVAQFKQQNPNGQKCDASTSGTNTNENAGADAGATTPVTNETAPAKTPVTTPTTNNKKP